MKLLFKQLANSLMCYVILQKDIENSLRPFIFQNRKKIDT